MLPIIVSLKDISNDNSTRDIGYVISFSDKNCNGKEWQSTLPSLGWMHVDNDSIAVMKSGMSIMS